ncbi:MAG: polymorphic toxin type 33 domain-containing protein [Dehalococcoidia bacterium]
MNRRKPGTRTGGPRIPGAAVRRGLLASCLLVALLASSAPYSLSVPAARAQEPAETVSATPSDTATAEPLPTATPSPARATTETATSEATDTASPEPTETPTATPTPTPTPNPDLIVGEVDAAGGTVAAADGRVEVVFPPGAATERLRVQISARDPDTLPLNDEHRPIATWSFTAAAVDRGWASVEQFAGPVEVKFRPTPEQLDGLMYSSVRAYFFDEGAGRWVDVPSQMTGVREWTATTDHFTEYGIAGDLAVLLPPLTDQAAVDLSGGAAALSLPIELPPGRGGVAPSLALTYSSAAVNEMKSRFSVGSWVGVGFNLDLPYISQTGDGANARYFLNLNGVGGEIVETVDGDFRLKHENHLKVKDSCTGAPAGQPCWTVVDKSGDVYLFGGTEDSYRYWQNYMECFGGTCVPPDHPYRFDLSSATDIHGNSYAVEYEREFAITHHWFSWNPGSPYLGAPEPADSSVMASYPSAIIYNGGEARVEFSTSWDVAHTDVEEGEPYSGSQTLYLRNDVPYPVTHQNDTCGSYSIPTVIDTKRLDQIEVLAHQPGSPLERVRRYTFEYNDPVPKGCDPSGNPDGAADLLLEKVKLWDRGATEVLYAQEFGYTPYRFYLERTSPVENEYDYTRPFLTSYTNGFGGETIFDYEEMDGGSGPGYWSRAVVTKRRVKQLWGGLFDTDVRTTYGYSTYPDYLPHSSTGPLGLAWEFKGYGEVTATDLYGDYSVHKFYTVVQGSPDTYDQREGREYEVARYAAGGGPFLRKTENTWSTAFTRSAASTSVDPVTFVYLSQSKTTLDDGKVLQTDNQVTNGTGWMGGACSYTELTCEITLTYERGDTANPNDNRRTELRFLAGQAGQNVYLVKPRWTKTYEGDTGPLVAETAFYYDGASSDANFSTPNAKGNLTATRSTAETDPSYVCTYLQYDSYGNVVKTSVPTTDPSPTTCPSGQTNPTGGIPAGVAFGETVYDATFHKYPLVQNQPFVNVPLETTVLPQDFDFVLGQAKKVTLANGNVVEYEYDGFGRPLKAWDTLTSQAAPHVEYEYDWGQEPNTIKVITRTGPDPGDTVWTLHCYDGYGRELSTLSPYSATQRVVPSRTVVDALGRPKLQSLPEATDSSTCIEPVFGTMPLGTVHYYDTLGRTTTVDEIGSGQTTFTYTGLTTAVVDANGHKRESVADGRGRTTAVKEYTGTSPYTLYATTTYAYDALDNLGKVTDALLNETTMDYDMLGRKTQMADPDMGTWYYTYDAAGNLKTQLDSRGVETTLDYDALSRLLSKSYDGGTPEVTDGDVTYVYDEYPLGSPCQQSANTAYGQLTFMDDDPGEEDYCYDLRGRQEQWRRTIGPDDYDVATTYDLAGRVVDLTYPDGEVLHHTYDAYHGALTGMCEWVSSACTSGGTYVSNVTYTAAGMPDQLPLGNGLTTDYNYETAHPSRLSSITTGSVQDLSYTYDPVGNIETMTDAAGGTETLTFAYDALDRLTDATGYAGALTAHYEYDKIGNLTRKKEGQLDLTLVYPASSATSVRPHAVTKVVHRTTDPTQGPVTTYKSFAYDAAGNLDYVNSAAESDYAFDAENRIQQRTYGAARVSYVYDGAGAMVKRTTEHYTEPAANETTVYVGGLYEENLTTDVVTKYYSALGRTIAMRKGGEVSYLLADHLGATTAVLDDAGNVTASHKYWPFGAERELSGDGRATDRWYTGQKEEDFDGLGLYNYRARMYSTLIGRFVSVDPIVGRPFDPQSWNPYTYVRNNPLSYVDPFGLTPECFMFCTGSPSQLMLDEDEQGETVIYPQDQGPAAAQPVTCDIHCQWLAAKKEYEKAAHQQLVGALLWLAEVCQPSCIPIVGPDGRSTHYVRAFIPESTLADKLKNWAEERVEYIKDNPEELIVLLLSRGRGAGKRTPATGEPNSTRTFPKPGRNPAQDKRLTPGEIRKLIKAEIDPHSLKQRGQDLYKDKDGNIYAKPIGGAGPGESTGINIRGLP